MSINVKQLTRGHASPVNMESLRRVHSLHLLFVYSQSELGILGAIIREKVAGLADNTEK